MTLESVLKLLRSEAKRAGSQTALARRFGVSIPYLNDVLQERREPGPAILAGLKLHKVVSYERNKSNA